MRAAIYFANGCLFMILIGTVLLLADDIMQDPVKFGEFLESLKSDQPREPESVSDVLWNE